MDILTSPMLSGLTWLEHGFGTREGPRSQDGMATLKQIHSAVVHIAQGAGSCGEGDGLLTNVADTALSIRTADCLPILLADTGRRAVGAIHAGWRGTAAGVIGETISRMRSAFGADPAYIRAAIGPGIGVCCYEVGDEVGRLFVEMTAERHLDLAAANRRQLIEAGVPESQIHVTAVCTFCDSRRFHSFRRDKDDAGRMISFIRIRG